MKLTTLLLALTLLCTQQSHSQNTYKLLQTYEKADINYRSMDTMSYWPVEKPYYQSMLKGFKPKKGKYTVKTFLWTRNDCDLKYEQNGNTCHEFIILKLDKKGKVIDGYQYTLEWAEMPLNVDLHRVTKKGVLLKDGMPVSAFGFKRLETEKGEGYLESDARLSLKK
jgi:hypothetical protein